MTNTYVRKYKWGKLAIKADFSQASDNIRYSVDDGPIRTSPLQVADARHDAGKALSMVNRWLKSEVR